MKSLEAWHSLWTERNREMAVALQRELDALRERLLYLRLTWMCVGALLCGVVTWLVGTVWS